MGSTLLPVRRLLPNALTLLRLGALPFLAWAVLGGRGGLTAGLLVASAGTDVLDGLLARRLRAQTRLGALLDPIADKLTQVTGLVLLSLTARPAFTPVPPLFVALVIGRDLLLLYGALRIRQRTGTLSVTPSWEGKATTGLIFLLLLAASLGLPRAVVTGLCLVTAPLVVATGVRYTLLGRRQFSGSARSGP